MAGYTNALCAIDWFRWVLATGTRVGARSSDAVVAFSYGFIIVLVLQLSAVQIIWKTYGRKDYKRLWAIEFGTGCVWFMIGLEMREQCPAYKLLGIW